jgi:hypothetical protein
VRDKVNLASTLAALQHALDKAGVVFLEAGDTRDGGLRGEAKEEVGRYQSVTDDCYTIES